MSVSFVQVSIIYTAMTLFGQQSAIELVSRQPGVTPRTAAAKMCRVLQLCQCAQRPVSATLPPPEISAITPAAEMQHIPFLATSLRGACVLLPIAELPSSGKRDR